MSASTDLGDLVLAHICQHRFGRRQHAAVRRGLVRGSGPRLQAGPGPDRGVPVSQLKFMLGVRLGVSTARRRDGQTDSD
jgi:hypothetical protein